MQEYSSAVPIDATQKSEKLITGSPSSGSPPLNFDERMPLPEPPPIPEPNLPHIVRIGSGGSSQRQESASGGVSVVLDEAGSWSSLADKSATVPNRAKSSGMLGFMKRKGRASSPKPQEPGVLGREGARVIIA